MNTEPSLTRTPAYPHTRIPASLLLFLLATVVMAQVGQFGPQQTQVKGVVLRGRVVCVPCELQRQYGVGGHAAPAPHLVGLKTAEGLLFTVLPGEAARPLLGEASWLGKEIDLNGRTFPRAMVLEVFRFAEVKPAGATARAFEYFCFV